MLVYSHSLLYRIRDNGADCTYSFESLNFLFHELNFFYFLPEIVSEPLLHVLYLLKLKGNKLNNWRF